MRRDRDEGIEPTIADAAEYRAVIDVPFSERHVVEVEAAAIVHAQVLDVQPEDERLDVAEAHRGYVELTAVVVVRRPPHGLDAV